MNEWDKAEVENDFRDKAGRKLGLRMSSEKVCSETSSKLEESDDRKLGQTTTARR